MPNNRCFDRKSLTSFLCGTAFSCGLLFAAPAGVASEIITAEDFVKRTVVNDQLVKVSDNVIILFDTSSSMNNEFRDTGQSRLHTALTEFKKRLSYFPEIGHIYAIYEYTPWKEIYPPSTFNRAAALSAFEKLPEKGSGPTPLAHSLRRAEDVIKGLQGRTTLFLFYDGDYTGGNPDPALWRLTHEYDVCLVIVSSAKERIYDDLQHNVAKLNPCSRVIPFETFINRPEYTTGLVYDVVATEEVITVSQQKVVGLGVEDAVFNFDEEELTAEDKKELDAVGQFMNKYPASYAVLSGYTDNVGIEQYNEHLSRQRTETVAEYLKTSHGIDESRLVLHWYGSHNPVASNSTPEGRAQNRRVEIAIGGL